MQLLFAYFLRFQLDLESLDDVKKALALDAPKLGDGTAITIEALAAEKPAAKAQKRKADDDDEDDSSEDDEEESDDESGEDAGKSFCNTLLNTKNTPTTAALT